MSALRLRPSRWLRAPLFPKPVIRFADACVAFDLRTKTLLETACLNGHAIAMSKNQNLTSVLADQVNQVSNGIRHFLERHVTMMTTKPTLSDETRKQIIKRVPFSQLQKYLTVEMAIALLALEISDLGTRISHYQHIVRYREHFNAPNKPMGAAFVMHTHILRGSEIYIIMARCEDWLKFFYALAVDLDLGPTHMAKKLQTRFKKEFERHLRERHRIVHAHERPSLASWMVGAPPEDLDHPDFAKLYVDTAGMLVDMLHKAIGEQIKYKSADEALKAINVRQLEAVDRECFTMWSIFLDHINGLIDSEKLLK